MHSDLNYLGVPKSEIAGASATRQTQIIQWARLVPVMFDGVPLTSGAQENGDLYVITGENLPRIDELGVEGVFRSTHAGISDKEILLTGLILTTLP